MICVRMLTISLAFILATSFVKCSNETLQSILSVATIASSKENLELEHSSVERDHFGSRAQIRYVLGNRTRGDRIVGKDSNSYTWNTFHDIELTLSYPKSGAGSILTFIEILVDQSSTLTDAYIQSGGIGQRRISVVVTARQTLYFTYDAKFYGL